MSSANPISALILMADYGSDPTETATPYTVFVEAGWTVHFATENGATPACDKLLLEGVTQKVLGATKAVISQYNTMTESPSFQKPKAWTSADFSLEEYDLVFFPGGHDKAVRQLLEAPALQPHVEKYWSGALRTSERKKTVAAVCHGVQALSNIKHTEGEGKGKSVLHDVNTTALPAWMEKFAYYSTKLWLGDYYKTYGSCSKNVEEFVRECLDDQGKNQWKDNKLSMSPFYVEDEKYAYLTGRWPGDAQLLAEKIVATVTQRVGA